MNGEIENDQKVVAEELSEYFSTVTDDIEGSNTLSLSEDDFSSHPSVVNIANNFRSTEKFSFCSITNTETVKALESLNPRIKSMEWNLIPPKRNERHELTSSTWQLIRGNTQAVGKKENGFLFTKRMKEQIGRTTD